MALFGATHAKDALGGQSLAYQRSPTVQLQREQSESRLNRQEIAAPERRSVVIFGSQQITVDAVTDFLRRDLEVSAVFTSRRPHDDAYGYASIHDVATQHDIPVFEPPSIDRRCIEFVHDLAPELIVSTYYRNILPAALLEIPPLGCINVHPGRLPYYRGPIPTFWALVNGETSCAVTLHVMDAGVDTGPIIAQEDIPIDDDDTGFTLSARAMHAGHALLMRHIDAVLRGEIRPEPQDPTTGSYFGSFSERLRQIDWRRPSRAIFNQVRALTHPYAGGLTFSGERPLVIWRVQEMERGYAVSVPPGRIRKVHADGSFVIATADGCLTVTEYESAPEARGDEGQVIVRAGQTLSC